MLPVLPGASIMALHYATVLTILSNMPAWACLHNAIAPDIQNITYPIDLRLHAVLIVLILVSCLPHS